VIDFTIAVEAVPHMVILVLAGTSQNPIRKNIGDSEFRIGLAKPCQSSSQSLLQSFLHLAVCNQLSFVFSVL
jgi:hypothetical protein